ncbi:hypothetical protein DAMA08_002760 [Martiniozyma asiatica (nom. inval.)]|nr:hypothetical protein DAMA08_002760 [Martiniozyma asiatica]
MDPVKQIDEIVRSTRYVSSLNPGFANLETSTSQEFYHKPSKESIEVDDYSIVFKLMDELLDIRENNEKLKQQMWDSIVDLSDSLEMKVKGRKHTERGDRKKQKNPQEKNINSLLFGPELNNEELKELLKEKKQYNKLLESTITDYQKSFDLIMSELVVQRTELANTMKEKIEKEEMKSEKVKENIWKEWFKYNQTIENVSSLNGIDEILEKINDLSISFTENSSK